MVINNTFSLPINAGLKVSKGFGRKRAQAHQTYFSKHFIED